MEEEIKKAVEVLRTGGVILYPTDTIWGLGCDPTNEDAVKKIYQIKRRSESQSFLLLADSMTMVERYVFEVPEIAYSLVEVSDKPITIIYPEAKGLAQNVVAEDNSIGIRVTENVFCAKLIQRFRKPIVSTSANINGEAFPKSFNDITEKIKQEVDLIINPQMETKSENSPSSIIKLGVNGEIKIIRE